MPSQVEKGILLNRLEYVYSLLTRVLTQNWMEMVDQLKDSNLSNESNL